MCRMVGGVREPGRRGGAVRGGCDELGGRARAAPPVRAPQAARTAQVQAAAARRPRGETM